MASTLTAQTDDLAGALHALRADKAADPVAISSGCRRLQELVHGQPLHKIEALDRGALQSLARCVLAHRSQHLRVHATRAVRSVCFKNDEGRNRAIASGALAASVRVLAEALDVLEYHGSGGATTRQLAALIVAAPASEAGPAGPAAPPADVVLLTVEESAPELAAADAFAALVAVEEAANTLSALVNRHEQNTARAIEDGAAVAAGRALALLPTLKWPVDPLPGAAGAGGAGAAAVDPSLTAGTTTGATPASALQKATMLQMLLS